MQARQRTSLDNSSLEKVGARANVRPAALQSATPPRQAPLSVVAEGTSCSEFSSSTGTGRPSTDSAQSHNSSEQRRSSERRRHRRFMSLFATAESVSSKSSAAAQHARQSEGLPSVASARCLQEAAPAPTQFARSGSAQAAAAALFAGSQAQGTAQPAVACHSTFDTAAMAQLRGMLHAAQDVPTSAEELSALRSFNPYPQGTTLSQTDSASASVSQAASRAASTSLAVQACGADTGTAGGPHDFLAACHEPGLCNGGNTAGAAAPSSPAQAPCAAPAPRMRRSLSVSDMSQVSFRGCSNGAADESAAAPAVDMLPELALPRQHSTSASAGQAGSARQQPAAADPAQGAAQRTRAELQAGACAPCVLSGIRPLRILIVEDNKINQLVVCKALRSVLPSCEVHVADDGAQALQAVQAQAAFDLILMDLHMPNVDGFEATQQIRKSHPQKPVIVALTADMIVGVAERCMAVGMNDYVAKPFRVRDMSRVLRLAAEA